MLICGGRECFHFSEMLMLIHEVSMLCDNISYQTDIFLLFRFQFFYDKRYVIRVITLINVASN
jgi:hypothetical protein